MIFKIKSASAGGPNPLPPSHLNLAPAHVKKLIAVGGGKGGVGKTVLSSNISIYLSWLGKKVVVVDLDLGGANLHTSLGADAPTRTLSEMISGEVTDINELVQPTKIRGLSLISGATDSLNIANLPHAHKSRLLQQFQHIDADFVLLDLGAGTTANTIDFFNLADEKIVVVTPEPTSIENAYRFMKASYYRMIRSASQSPIVRQLVEDAFTQTGTQKIRSPKELVEAVSRQDPQAIEPLRLAISTFHLSLILNQVRSLNESAVGRNIERVASSYFGIQVDYLGYLPYDNSIWQAIRKRTPFLIEAPNTEAVTHLEGIVRNLLKGSGHSIRKP